MRKIVLKIEINFKKKKENQEGINLNQSLSKKKKGKENLKKKVCKIRGANHSSRRPFNKLEVSEINLSGPRRVRKGSEGSKV